MKALSIKQPWASLIISGLKPVENRTSKWNHKGPLAIHASKMFDKNYDKSILSLGLGDIIEKSKKLTGGFIGSVNMIDCVTEHDSLFFSGPYGYVFENPKKCDLVPYKGQQGVFNINYDSFMFHEIWEHFSGYYNCDECGELHKDFPIDTGNCPKCGNVLLPF